MWTRIKHGLGSLALALALFICIWVSRIFLAGEVVGSIMPLAGHAAVAVFAVVAGLLPALPLGLAYGFMRAGNVLAGAIIVALLACGFELAAASVAVPWWRFVTWWVLPLECVTVLLVFVLAALAGSRMLQRVAPVVRFRLALSMYALLTIAAVAWPWLNG